MDIKQIRNGDKVMLKLEAIVLLVGQRDVLVRLPSGQKMTVKPEEVGKAPNPWER